MMLSWMAALWWKDFPVLNIGFLAPFTVVVGIVGAVAAAFNKWLWSWSIFRGWYINRPDLRGTWKVELQSDWKDPDTGQGVPLITAYLAIRQSLTSLNLRLMTPESKSLSLAYSIDIEADEIYRVYSIYRNEPKLELQGQRSEIHHGSLVLEVHGEPPTSMEGNYWTDRNTTGVMKMTDRNKIVFSTFADADREYQSA